MCDLERVLPGQDLERKHCYKEKATAKKKVEREMDKPGMSMLKCFDLLKDLIRCRTTITDEAKFVELLEFVEENFTILACKNALDRRQVPTV